MEVQKIDNSDTRSWFVEDGIRKDGSIVTMTPIDPLFVLLPTLKACRKQTTESQGNFLSIDDILHNEHIPNLYKLHQIQNVEDLLTCVCDYQDISSIRMFRLNDQKTIHWIKAKVNLLTSSFSQFESLQCLNPATSLSDSISESAAIRQLKTKIAWNVVKDYISLDWAEKLEKEFNIEVVTESFNEAIQAEYASINCANNHDLEEHFDSKKRKNSTENPAGKGAKKSRVTANQKALKKASKGMNNISSFFKKKDCK
ncbi:ribonuclease H2, subunit B [Paraphysoderma sedebokerense]|nr:ribonuclease H2, subunit B [Paraphysoderma sedebokerense]